MTLLKKALLPLAVLLASLLAFSEEGCNPAQLSAFDQAIEAGQAALVPAESIACASATLLDPSGKTAICSTIDATGAAVGAAFTVAEDAAGIAALLNRTAPKSPAVGEALKTALAARVAALPASPSTKKP